MQTVTLDGTVYAVDLWWQVRAGGPASHKNMLHMARETAELLRLSDGSDYNCVAIRTTQYGLGKCPLSNGKVPRLPSLVAAIRPPSTSFLGVFQLAEGWWVCGISQGSISANGDRLLGSLDEALSSAARLRGNFDSCQEKVCRSEEESLDFLRPLLLSEARIERLYVDQKERRKLMALALGVGILLSASLGVKLFLDARENQHLQVLNRQLFQDKEARRHEILADPARYFEKTWLNTPVSSVRAGQCLPPLLQIPAVSNGWPLASATCSGTDRKAKLNITRQHRPGASFSDLPAGFRFGKSAREIASSLALPAVDATRSEIPLLSRSDAEGRLYQITQSIGAKLRLNWSKPESRQIEEVTVTSPWQRGAWDLSDMPAALMLTSDCFVLLETIPGLTLESFRYEKAGWSLKGNVYAMVK